MWSMVAQRVTQITPPAVPPDQLWQRVEAVWSALYPKNTSKVYLNQCRAVWQRCSPTMAATLATDSGRNHTSQKVVYSCCPMKSTVVKGPRHLNPLPSGESDTWAFHLHTGLSSRFESQQIPKLQGIS
ncbi:hypothetical protein TNCV_847081 [Trichonephila clavipes]|nr:hypothetical protein TNCV_847081 [Trichonephila clavipes]